MKFDADILRLKAHVDQARAEMRSIVRETATEDLVALIKRCARGDLATMDQRQQLLVGMLATGAIFDLAEGPAAADELLRCPKCGAELTDHMHDPDGRRVCGACGHAWDEPDGS